MYEQATEVVRSRLRGKQSGVDATGNELDVSAESPGSRNLGRIRLRRNEDCRGDIEAGRRVGHALGVVPSAGRDHATGAHVRVGKGDPGEGATHLERGGALFVLALEPDRHAGQPGQVRTAYYPGASGDPGQDRRGPVDIDVGGIDAGPVDGRPAGVLVGYGRAGS